MKDKRIRWDILLTGLAFLMLAVANGSTDSWGDLIPILVLVAVVITLVCEWFLWRWVKDYTVR